ncbi:hypothetical protein BDR26DRAFT_950403 [Obelidium mucronatum]|nr:hypothetical protein BDR26DRAFT_950403 [Obelidium mucronatum]
MAANVAITTDPSPDETQWPKETERTAIYYNKKYWDLTIDETGNKVRCKACKKDLVSGRRPFQFDRLGEHCKSSEHIRLCKTLDQAPTNIRSYFMPVDQSSSSGTTTSTAFTATALTALPPAPTKTANCFGVCPSLAPKLLDAFAIYGRVAADEGLTMVKRPGQLSFIVSACNNTGFRENKKQQCKKCKAKNSSLKDRISKMGDVVHTLEIMGQASYSVSDIAFLQRQTNIRRDLLSEKRTALHNQVKGIILYHKWALKMQAELQNHGIEITKGGNVIGTDSFLKDFTAMYKKAPQLKNSLLFGLLHVCIEKARGHVNAKIPPIVTNFCLMMSTYGKGPLELVSNNLPSISVGHLKAIKRRESSYCYLDLTEESLDKRLQQFEAKVVQAWMAAGVTLKDDEKIHVTCCMDATKVVKALVYNSKYHCQIGRKYPNHMMPQSSLIELSTSKVDDLADEVKVFVIMLNKPPPKMSPMFVFCGILQGKNDPSPTLWNAAHNALQKSSRLVLGSVAVDGLDAPFAAAGLLDFLNHGSSLIFTLDTHHGVKCARGQFTLGSAIKDCGSGILDPASAPNTVEEDAAEKDRYVERLAQDLANAVAEMDEDDAKDMDTLLQQLVVESASKCAEMNETVSDCSTAQTGRCFRNFLKQIGCQSTINFDRREYLCKLALELLSVVEQEHGVVKDGAEAPQQHGTIKQRFWNTSVPNFEGSSESIGRGSVFHIGDKSYAVFGVFKLTYNKWRLEDKVSKADNAIVHAMKVTANGYTGVTVDFPLMEYEKKQRDKHYLLMKLKDIKHWDG